MRKLIELKNVSKTFSVDGRNVQAVSNVNLKINDSEIFGIIGYSGAGKSTLVRCLNLLERPDEGNVIIDGVDITKLSEKNLRAERKKIGMIFQQFNLLSSRTVFDNVAFPLHYSKIKKEEIEKRVNELLELVGIADKKNSYPSQLSGGQKQRVAIARALASNPKILLCDEATSALDPQTTNSILKLLKDVNKKLGITIVIITHEMNVIKEICDKVAVMQGGKVVEEGEIVQVFTNPKAQITKDFIATTSNIYRINDLIKEDSNLISIEGNQKILKVEYHGSNTKEAVISYLAKEFQVSASIIFADVEIIAESVLGSMIIIFSGDEINQRRAINYLLSNGIKVELIKGENIGEVVKSA